MKLNLLIHGGTVALGVTILGLTSPSYAWTMSEVLQTPAGSNISRIEALVVPKETPDDIIFSSINIGAECGGGTPASIWKATVDPITHKAISVNLVQQLSQVQNIRGTLFEAPNGDFFSGGGWCGPKPPYYSTDGAVTWQPATKGIHPPNSTFSFTGFGGRVYAGTGYDPYPGQVYRWLGPQGPNMFQLVLSIPQPRTIVGALISFKNTLFVGSSVYGSGNCHGTTAIYKSNDGSLFDKTSGIPDCATVLHFMKVQGHLIAATVDLGSANVALYEWTGVYWQAKATVPLLGVDYYLITTDSRSIFAFGTPRPGLKATLYRSSDLGSSWSNFATTPRDAPAITVITAHDGGILAASMGDANGLAHIYWYPTK